MGNLNCRPVQLGNAQATAAAFLYDLACLRSVLCVTENPCNTFLFKLDSWKLVASVFPLAFACACRYAFDKRPYDKRFLKRYKLAGGAWVSTLERKCRCPGCLHAKLCSAVCIMGRLRVTGNQPTLKKSGVYPRAFGKWIIKKWAATLTAQSSPKATTCKQPEVLIKQPLLNQMQQARKGAQPEVPIKQPQLNLLQQVCQSLAEDCVAPELCENTCGLQSSGLGRK